MSAYGYEIVQTLIVDIEPDVHVKRSMNEINAGIYPLSLTLSDLLRNAVTAYPHLSPFPFLPKKPKRKGPRPTL